VGGGADGCTVTAGERPGTVVFGTILGIDTVFEGGAVAFDDTGAITCVGCDCAAQAAGFTQVSCGEAVVSPGMINAHDHAGWMNEQPWYLVGANSSIPDALRWEQRHDWRRGKRGHPDISAPGGANNDAKALGEFRFALSGATATFASGGFSSASGGVLRNLDAAGDATALGIRRVHYETFPLGDTGGQQLASGCGYPGKDYPTDGPNAPHVSEGVDVEARNEFLCLTDAGIAGGKDVIDENTAIIHGVGLTPFDVAVMGERGASLIWSPRSNISLYGETAPVALMKRMGINIALGTDWIPSGSINMSRELRCAIDLNDNNFGGVFTREDLWRMVTINAARALHADEAIGSLQVGRRADLAVFTRAANVFASVVESTPEDVILVLKDGRPLNGNAAVVASLDNTCDTLDVCGVQKRVCASRETGKDFAALDAGQNGARYALFNCDGETPLEEPTCVPSRTDAIDAIGGSTLYTGVPAAGDADGDGIADAQDNCPTVFNPIRPVDGGAQANADDDAQGDVCDPCPLDANTTECTAFDPNDRDGDGVAANGNPPDNCPDDANADQADADTDGIGDVCDPCPNAANPGGQGCPVSIYDVKTNLALSTPPSRVRVNDLVVTAVAGNGFFAQLDPTATGFNGVDNSCIFSFVGTGTKPALGDKVTIDGNVQNRFDQIQFSTPTFTVTGTGSAIAPTVLANAAAITTALTNGPRAPLEGCLVQVNNAVVTDAAPPGGAGDTAPVRNEFEIDGGLRVDDNLFLISPQPDAAGQSYTSIRGPLSWRNEHMKLLPRSAADVVEGPVTLDSVEGGFVRVATTSTGITTAIRVRLSRAADADTVVTLQSLDTGIFTVPASVTVATGSFTADIDVTGVATGTANLRASLDGQNREAAVIVLAADAPAAVVAANPNTVSLVTGQTQVVTLTLDIPAPSAGATIALSTDPAVVTAPASVAVPANALSVDVELVGVAPGTATVTATLGGDVDIDVSVTDVPPLGFVINEVDYDQPGTDTTEAIELFNGTLQPIELAGVELLFINGSATANRDVYRTVTLSGTLPAGAFLVAGPAGVVNALGADVVKTVIDVSQDIMQNGAPDAIVLVAGGAIVDAISYEGELSGITVGDETVDLTVANGNALTGGDLGAGSICRNGTGVWGVCATASIGAANP